MGWQALLSAVSAFGAAIMGWQGRGASEGALTASGGLSALLVAAGAGIYLHSMRTVDVGALVMATSLLSSALYNVYQCWKILGPRRARRVRELQERQDGKFRV
ncbi:hypothetical protein T484DRAFT_1797849 [Baffinella frigidus]|nr:hypothetical protein T484DRAFT_1797849 [Cryptophyta sp. CCMP2293]